MNITAVDVDKISTGYFYDKIVLMDHNLFYR